MSELELRYSASEKNLPSETEQDGSYLRLLANPMEVVRALVSENIKTHQDLMKRYDKRSKNRHFTLGDVVWIYRPKRRASVPFKLVPRLLRSIHCT